MLGRGRHQEWVRSQRLVRRLCPNCREPKELSAADKLDLGIPSDIPGQAYKAVGCDRCRGTGFSGRLAIYEVALVTDTMQDLVAHGASAAPGCLVHVSSSQIWRHGDSQSSSCRNWTG